MVSVFVTIIYLALEQNVSGYTQHTDRLMHMLCLAIKNSSNKKNNFYSIYFFSFFYIRE